MEELDSRAIDCVWNGMTLTDDVLVAMGTSNPYCTNYQTLVYPADRSAEFEGLTSLEGLNIAVESGSAGEDAAVALGATTVPVQAQSNALMEVAAGTSDAAVIDVLMAAEMTGEGTSYADLAYSLNLNDTQGLPSEEYGVGFRQGSDLVDAFNSFWADKTVWKVVEVKNSNMVSSSQGVCSGRSVAEKQSTLWRRALLFRMSGVRGRGITPESQHPEGRRW